MRSLAIILCLYLLFCRPFLNRRYPLFYSYLLLSLGFELLLSLGDLQGRFGWAPRIVAYQLIYLFQLYLLAYLWREVLQRDYPSLRLMIYLLMGLASVTTLLWRAPPLSHLGLTGAVESARVLDGLAAPSFFAALVLVITLKAFCIPVPRPLRGMVYGLTLLTGADFLAIFVSDGRGFIHGYDRVLPWLASLIIYCRYFTFLPRNAAGLNPAQPSMLTTIPQLLTLDQGLFYGFMVKARLYNPITEAYYYRFYSTGLLDAVTQAPTLKAHFRKLYATHRYCWAGAYYRIVDRLILGPTEPVCVKVAGPDWKFRRSEPEPLRAASDLCVQESQPEL